MCYRWRQKKLEQKVCIRIPAANVLLVFRVSPQLVKAVLVCSPNQVSFVSFSMEWRFEFRLRAGTSFRHCFLNMALAIVIEHVFTRRQGPCLQEGLPGTSGEHVRITHAGCRSRVPTTGASPMMPTLRPPERTDERNDDVKDAMWSRVSCASATVQE